MKTQTTQQDKFNFFIPLEIEKGVDGKLVKISGVCSTDAEDSDGETLIPAGFDFTPLLQSGFLNWNHQARSTSKAICGEPTAAKVINNGRDFFIEGVLYPNAEGKNVVELAETLAQHSPNRRLGFSIEGQATERDILNPKKVTKARITGVAITQCPKNPNTLMNIVKGEYGAEFVGDEIELNQLPKSNDDIVVLNIACSSSGAVQLQNIIEGIRDYGNAGHSYTVIIDPDSDKPLKIGWDGDGSDRIISIDTKQELDKSTEVKEGANEVELDKAMMVNIELNPPSIDGVENKNKLVHLLKKSDIYNQIRKRYTQDFEKAQQVYDFIDQVKQKNMITEKITPDVLSKAFEILDNSILQKSEDTKSLDDYDKKDDVDNDEDNNNTNIDKSQDSKDDSNDDDDDDEEFEKAMNVENFAKSCFERGMGKDEVMKALTSIGVNLTLAETACSNCISQANQAKQGGDITVLQKGENDELSLQDISNSIDRKFGAIATILKSHSEQDELRIQQIVELKNSNTNLMSQVNKISTEPQARRSVTSAKVLERFEKSEDGKSNIENFDSSNITHMRELGNRLYGEVELIKSQGREDRVLEKAVADLEIAKTTNWAAISPRLQAMNIKVY